MSIWGDASPWFQGQRVYGAIDNCPGTVVSVDAFSTSPVFAVRWEDAVGEVIYPHDTIMVRKAWPWE